MKLFFPLCLLVWCTGCQPEPETTTFPIIASLTSDSWSWNQPCPANFTCDYLPVSFQYQSHTQSTYLHYALRPAPDQANKLGTLLINPGGPGHEGVQFVGHFLNQKLNLIQFGSSFDQTFFDRFDIVGFDPMGTGKSGFADEIRQCRYLQHKYPQEQQACFHMAPFVSTNRTVQAIEQLRQHLEQTNQLIDGKIDLLGISYGTTLFSTYTHLHPKRVRSLILDSPTWPTYISWLEMVQFEAPDYVRSVAYIYQQNQQSLDELNQQYTQSLQQDKIKYLQALQLDIQAASSNDQIYNFAGLWYINCLDQQQPYQLNADDFVHLTDYEIIDDLLYQYAKLCSGWYTDKALLDPIWPTGFEVPVADLPPILIIAHTYDLKTPFSGAIERRQLYPHSQLIEIKNSTLHGISFSNMLSSFSQCANDATIRYLENPAALQASVFSCQLNRAADWGM
jgi:pimeloyl-ACP methyl ester carboxylesterase